MTVCRDVLHHSVLGEKDEPIRVINLLHIKANMLRKKSSCSILSIGRRWGKNRRRKACPPRCCQLWF